MKSVNEDISPTDFIDIIADTKWESGGGEAALQRIDQMTPLGEIDSSTFACCRYTFVTPDLARTVKTALIEGSLQ